MLFLVEKYPSRPTETNKDGEASSEMIRISGSTTVKEGSPEMLVDQNSTEIANALSAATRDAAEEEYFARMAGPGNTVVGEALPATPVSARVEQRTVASFVSKWRHLILKVIGM